MVLTPDSLYQFIREAQSNTFAGKQMPEKQSERVGFTEFTYHKEPLSYRDSFSGYFQSWGSEVVRLEEKPVWVSNYGGGIVEHDREMTRKVIRFLKMSLGSVEEGFTTFRGPHNLRIGHFEYSYNQDGDIERFHGKETITYQKKLWFSHEIIGGVIVGLK